MKKLTAGIFATILGVTAMGAADAAVTSKGYVDAALATKANASEVSTLSSTVAGHTTDIAGLKSADTTLQNNIDAVVEDVEALDGKVGTIPSTATATTVVGYVDEMTSGIASDETVSALSEKVTALETASTTHAIKTEVEAALADKADASALASYVTVSDYNSGQAAQNGQISANQDAIDAIEADYLKAADIANLATKSEVNDMATKTWVGEQGYITNAALSNLATESYADTAATNAANAKDAAIADAKKAGTDAAAAAATADGKAVAAQADATQALADAATADGKAVAAQAAAEAAQATANAAIKAPAACSDPTNMCVLVSNGTTVSWQVIANVYPDNNGTLN